MDVYGKDIKDTWTFIDGDLETVESTTNIGQACVNRLNTDKRWYDWAYANYGGDLFTVFGMKNNEHSLEYLRIEISSILQQDPRIRDIDVTCTKNSARTVDVELKILPVMKDEIITLNLVITDDLVVQLDTDIQDKIATGDRL